ncbi:MAG: N-6 DNA methylase [Treponema sp.]
MSSHRIIDYVSGKEVDGKQEEVLAVQPFSKILVDDYHYPKNELQTHPQYTVKSCPSDTKGYPIDIAVFENRGTKNEKLKMIVECKKPTRQDGREQLEIYLKFCNAQIGVWYNGNESLYLRKIEKSGNITFEEMASIPQYKESLSEIGKYRRNQLEKTHNLKDVFLDMRGFLVGNATGTTRDEFIAKQIINIILCKIYDERFTAPNDIVKFRTTLEDDEIEVFNRISELFLSVKAKYRDVLDETDKIEFDPKSLKHIVGKLQKYCVTECERDIVSDAFEVFIGYSLKGEQGQFFTPQNVIQLMLAIINPDTDELIIDPSCGSGGFLVESLRYIWRKIDIKAKKLNWSETAIGEEKKEAGIKLIRGLDKDSFLTKVAKSYMTILGDGKGGIFCEDSLERPENWKSLTQTYIKLDSFDVIMTNPPFGKDIQVVGENKLMQYDLAHKTDSKGKIKILTKGNVSTIFFERNLQLLKKGGRLGIILPETYFHAPSQKEVFNFFFKNNNVTHVIDLPHNTFRPYNNAKCIILVLKKGEPQQKYIIMAVAEQMGHDHQGKTIYRIDENGNETNIIWDDVNIIIDEIKGKRLENKYIFEVESNEVIKKGILVPRYYWHKKEILLENEAKEKKLQLISIQQLIDEKIIKCFDGNGSPQAQFKGTGDIPYIRVKDIVNWQVYTDVTALIPENEYNRLYKMEKQLMPKDILYVRRGSYRIGSVAMVSPYNLKCILTREILVIRVIDLNNKYKITPEYLMYALSHKIVAEESENKVFIDTTLPNIADRWKEVKIPLPTSLEKLSQITEIMKNIVSNQWKAQEDIENCKKHFDVYSV